MSRSQRLLNLIQLLRSHRFPVPGTQLAEALQINLRTLHRDITTQRGAEAPTVCSVDKVGCHDIASTNQARLR